MNKISAVLNELASVITGSIADGCRAGAHQHCAPGRRVQRRPQPARPATATRHSSRIRIYLFFPASGLLSRPVLTDSPGFLQTLLRKNNVLTGLNAVAEKTNACSCALARFNCCMLSAFTSACSTICHDCKDRDQAHRSATSLSIEIQMASDAMHGRHLKAAGCWRLGPTAPRRRPCREVGRPPVQERPLAGTGTGPAAPPVAGSRRCRRRLRNPVRSPRRPRRRPARPRPPGAAPLLKTDPQAAPEISTDRSRGSGSANKPTGCVGSESFLSVRSQLSFVIQQTKIVGNSRVGISDIPKQQIANAVMAVSLRCTSRDFGASLLAY